MGPTEDLHGIQRLLELNEKANAKYMDWVRQMLTLSIAALTALIALRSNLVGASPRWPFLLQVCWISFGASAVCAAMVLYGEIDVYRRAVGRSAERLGSGKDQSETAIPQESRGNSMPNDRMVELPLLCQYQVIRSLPLFESLGVVIVRWPVFTSCFHSLRVRVTVEPIAWAALSPSAVWANSRRSISAYEFTTTRFARHHRITIRMHRSRVSGPG